VNGNRLISWILGVATILVTASILFGASFVVESKEDHVTYEAAISTIGETLIRIEKKQDDVLENACR